MEIHVKENPIFGSVNEEDIPYKILDPSTENPFHTSHIMSVAAVTQFVQRFCNSLQPGTTDSQAVHSDDIPID